MQERKWGRHPKSNERAATKPPRGSNPNGGKQQTERGQEDELLYKSPKNGEVCTYGATDVGATSLWLRG